MTLELTIVALLFLLLLTQIWLVVKVASQKDKSKETASELQLLRETLQKEAKSNRAELQDQVMQQFALLFDSLRESARDQSKVLKEFGQLFRDNVREFNDLQREKFQELVGKQERMLASTEEKLEKMRETVDEKLQKTLEERLGRSFELVGRQLLEVQKGLGEMQHLATGVGDLKRVLSNVKTRGMLGEYQLQGILENILTPEQIETNFSVNSESNERVEFAVKMPGNGEDGPVFLPIDAKFPQESYHRLLDAYETGDKDLIAGARLEIYRSVKKCAVDISSKYIRPPFTTDFAVMFLPTESLYAELLRDSQLVLSLQKDYRVVIAGPTTLAAMLNSLQMGFRTLAIQKRSGEVWQILGAVKMEFSKFGDMISKAQKKISDAHHDLDELVGKRARAIQRKLRSVEALPEDESRKMLE